MSNELQYYGDPVVDTGLTVVARVYNSSGVQVGSDVATTEVGALAIYRGDMPVAIDGEYGVRFFSGTLLLGQETISWDGTAERTILGNATPTNVTDAQTAIIAQVDANEAKIDLIETKIEADARQVLLIAEHDATQATLANKLDTSSYTAPDNAGIAAIQERTDNLPDTPASKADTITASQL